MAPAYRRRWRRCCSCSRRPWPLRQPGETPTREQILETVAESTPHLTPDMILGLLAQRESARPEDAQVATGILERMTDETIASFVARSVD